MSLISSILKTAVAAKVVQVASRELAKPENQRRLKEGLSKLAKQARKR
jgi:histidinol dehydrogenase